MKREFSINLILLIAINLVVKPLYIFGIDRTVQNEVGTEVYGLYFAIFNFTYLFYIINDFGLQNYSNRFIAQNRQLIGRYLPNILGLKAILLIFYFLFVISFGWFIGYFPAHWEILLLMGLNQALVALMFYFRANLSGLGFYKQDSIISVMDRGLLILIVGAMLLLPAWRSNFQIEWFILAQTVSLVLTIITLAFLVIPKARLTGLQFNWKSWPKILKESAPYALVVVLMTFYTRLDSVMIERMLPDGAYESGVYASAYRLLDAFNMMGFLIAGLLLPIFSRMFKEKEALKPFFNQSLQLVIALSASVALGCFFFRQPIMELLYTNATPYWGNLLAFLLPTFLFTSGTYVAGTFLTASGDLARLNKLLLIGVILNFTLNILLIPQYKAIGAAASTLVTQGIMFLLQLEFSRRILQAKIDFIQIGKVLFFFLLSGSLCWGITYLSFIPWILQLFLAGISVFALSFLLKVIHPQFVQSLIKSE